MFASSLSMQYLCYLRSSNCGISRWKWWSRIAWDRYHEISHSKDLEKHALFKLIFQSLHGHLCNALIGVLQQCSDKCRNVQEGSRKCMNTPYSHFIHCTTTCMLTPNLIYMHSCVHVCAVYSCLCTCVINFSWNHLTSTSVLGSYQNQADDEATN